MSVSELWWTHLSARYCNKTVTYITFVGTTHVLFQFVHSKITDIFIARRHFLRVIYVLSVYEFNLHGLSLTHIRIQIGFERVFKINVSLHQISCSHGNVDVIVDFLGCNTVCTRRQVPSFAVFNSEGGGNVWSFKNIFELYEVWEKNVCHWC